MMIGMPIIINYLYKNIYYYYYYTETTTNNSV